MTKEKIIEIIEKYQAESSDLILRNWQFSAIAYEFLALVEQEKKEMAKNFAKDLLRQANFWGEKDNIWFNYETLKKVAKEYGVTFCGKIIDNSVK